MALAPAVLPEEADELRQYCRQLLAELQAQQQLVAKLTHVRRRPEKFGPGRIEAVAAGEISADGVSSAT